MYFGLIKSKPAKSADKPAKSRRACRRPSFVRPKEAKARPGLKKNLFAYAADARWDELKPYAHPPLQGNSPSSSGLSLLRRIFLRAALPIENDEGNYAIA